MEFIAPLLGSVISTAGGIFTNTRNTSAQERINRENLAEQRRINDLNYRRDLELFEKNKQYNLPKNQMARLKEAGLNPHLIYGHMVNSVGASPTSRAEAARAHAPRESNPLESFLNLGQIVRNAQMAQTAADHMELENKKFEQDIISKRLNNELTAAKIEKINRKPSLFEKTMNFLERGSRIYRNFKKPSFLPKWPGLHFKKY